MKAQDFIKTYEKISDDNRHSTFFKSRTMFEFAEDYHQAKLNLLTIPVVVGSLPTDKQIDDKVDRVTASTWGDYGAGYIDGTRNGAQWVVDVVNGEDK